MDVELVGEFVVSPREGGSVIVGRWLPDGELSVMGGGTITGAGGDNLGKEEMEGGNTGVDNGEAGRGEVGDGGSWEISGGNPAGLEVGFAVGAVASCLVGLGWFRNLTPAAVTPTVNSTAAAVGVHAGRPFFQLRGLVLLRFGNATTSAAYSSRAVAKSNSCSTLRSTTGPDSCVASRPRKR